MAATRLEAEKLRPLPIAVAAFGQIDAAIAAMRLMEDQRPTMCVLVGLAGTLRPDELPIGSVVEASGFRSFGIGAGAEPDLLGAAEMGLPEDCHGLIRPTELEAPTTSLDDPQLRRVEFLSVCASSAHVGQARVRAARFRQAKVEEMEGFGVARAARLLGVPFTSVRAISNVAGERDPARWEIDRALSGLYKHLEPLIRSFA